jgi:hypothetical protein
MHGLFVTLTLGGHCVMTPMLKCFVSTILNRPTPRADFCNEAKMKLEKKDKKTDASSSPRRRNKWRPDAKHHLSHQEKKSHGKSKKGEAKTGSRVDDSDPCPVHPGSSHTLGACFLNSRNKNKNKDDQKPAANKYKGKPKCKSEEVDANAMHCGDCSVASTASEGEMSSSDCDSKSSVDTKLKSAINDVSMTTANSNDNTSGFDIDMAEFIDGLNSTTSHPTNYCRLHETWKEDVCMCTTENMMQKQQNLKVLRIH